MHVFPSLAVDGIYRTALHATPAALAEIFGPWLPRRHFLVGDDDSSKYVRSVLGSQDAAVEPHSPQSGQIHGRCDVERRCFETRIELKGGM